AAPRDDRDLVSMMNPLDVEWGTGSTVGEAASFAIATGETGSFAYEWRSPRASSLIQRGTHCADRVTEFHRQFRHIPQQRHRCLDRAERGRPILHERLRQS